LATSMIRQRSEYNVRSKQKLQTRALKTLKITRSQLLLYIHPRKQRHQVGHPRTSYSNCTNLQPPSAQPGLPLHSPRSRISSRTLTRESWEQRTASARRRLKRRRVWGPSRQALEAVIHKTLRQGCALGSAAVRPLDGTASDSHVQAQSNGSRATSCRERMEHVIIVCGNTEGSVALSHAGGCTVVALCPRGGRGKMVDRANEVELGAWRVGSRLLLDALG
jgi:hypothetical protein